jgi:hypothetical protein
VRNNWSHLRISIGVSQDKFFLFQLVRDRSWADVIYNLLPWGRRKLVPLEWFRSVSGFYLSVFKVLQLLNKRGSYFQIRPSGVEKFKRFHQSPPEFLHQVNSDNGSRPGLAPNWVDKHTFLLFEGLLHKIKNLLSVVVPLIENYLALLVHPEKWKVHNLDVFPVVGHLSRWGVDDMSHLVRHDKLQILKYDFHKPTWAANWSPIKRPSMIFIAPIMSSGIIIIGGGWPIAGGG